MTVTAPAVARPLYATTPDPALRTIGRDVAITARVMGQPFTPWQRHAADVLGTLRDDGRMRYRRAVVIVPRRAGKTWLTLNYALTVGRRRAMSRSFYAAHRRETAAAMWRDDWFPRLELSPLSRLVKPRQSNGSEAMTYRHNRSTFRLMPPDGDAMRSFASDLANVDEAREFTLEQGQVFERAVFPTQATGRGGQFVIWSNAGTGESGWLRKWRDLGRASIDDPSSQIAYIEYAAPDGADIADEAVWWAAHPGLGFHVDIDALRADHETLPPDDFAAEYLGLWPETQIDAELVAGWAAGVDVDAAPANPVVLAIEMSVDRDRTVIVAAGDNRDGRPAVELLEDQPHGPWWRGRLAELVTTHRPAALVWDAGGPVNALAHDLADVPVNLYPVVTRDVIAGAGFFHDRVLAGNIAHRDDPDMGTAIAAARHRAAGGAWLFDRRAPGALGVLAAALAVWRWSDGRSRPPTVS